ncbi:hypothetical protein A3Q56_07280 [Intoshia linei]|uniref:Uncharacterized protein n=1 Tax=Intoshia linei TaxID=1819745 RepID=A0A177AU34_9BILA|nr:hypothetical protein A3Q56_07280 [Intoshia linei]
MNKSISPQSIGSIKYCSSNDTPIYASTPFNQQI